VILVRLDLRRLRACGRLAKRFWRKNWKSLLVLARLLADLVM